MLVHCGQTVGWTKMILGMQVALGPGHIVLDGDPAPPPPKGHSPPIFGPYLLRPNGCMDQDGTWHGGRPQPRQLCVRWGPSPTPQKGGRTPSPIFGPFLLWPNGWMNTDTTWYGGSLSLGDIVFDGDPAPLPNKSSAVAEMGDRGHNRHEPKRHGSCCDPFAGGAGCPCNTMWPGPWSTSIPSGDFIHQPFGHNGHCPKFGGGCAPLGEGELGPHLTQCRQGRGIPACKVSS